MPVRMLCGVSKGYETSFPLSDDVRVALGILNPLITCGEMLRIVESSLQIRLGGPAAIARPTIQAAEIKNEVSI